jgi:Protein of unknown function (DUF1553)/Protein of unknown function (DUF1549)
MNETASKNEKRWRKHLLLLCCSLLAVGVFLGATAPHAKLRDRGELAKTVLSESSTLVAHRIDNELAQVIEGQGLQFADDADWPIVCRRISLALTGCTLSLQEYRAIETLGGKEIDVTTITNDQRIAWWTSYLLADSRWSDYFAERFSRAFVGTNQGPFIVFRRRRFTSWLAEEFKNGKPYDQIVREMISADGLWTGNPEVNFLTSSISREGGREVDAVVLAGRTSRAFLGMRMDCLQCHDDFMDKVYLGDEGNRHSGKQLDFHQLAAFYGSTAISKNPFLGLQDNRRPYQTALLGQDEESIVKPDVPFLKSDRTDRGSPREQLARWITDSDNKAFANATVNRVWAILFGKPMIDPVDDIPLDGPYPPGFEVLAQSFIDSQYDLRQLVVTIVATKAFRRDSRLEKEPITDAHELHWAVFPLTQLRPEQVAASLHQACRLQIIDDESSIAAKLERYGTLQDFTKAYGDRGEDEFISQPVTIPQRLLVMNGKFVRERIDDNPVANAGTQIALLAKDDKQAVEAAYLSTVNRLPTDEERAVFEEVLSKKRGPGRSRAVGDIFWVLLNSTEFLWNH